MTIKNRLNTIAILSITSLMALLGLILYKTYQIDKHLNQISRIDQFTETASKLNILTEQYLAYKKNRYLDNWENLYQRLKKYEPSLNKDNRNVLNNALPSIHDAFSLIKKVNQNPGKYTNKTKRQRLLNRAKARIRSDIQVLLSVAYNMAKNRRETVHNLQVNQRIYLLIILLPAILVIGYLTFKARNQIIQSLNKLLEGTKQIARGNLDTKIDIRESNEHSRLAREFNRMTNQLQKHIQREKKARKKAEETQARWERLVQQDPNLIMITINGKIQFINPAGARLCGAESPNELMGRSALEFIDEEDDQKALKRIEQVQKKGKEASATIYTIKGLDGTKRYLELESRPTTYKGQEAMQSVGLDMTNHIRYERELEETVKEKTTLLQEVHHRVKNNLAVVSGMIQMQRFSIENRELSELLNESERRIQSIALIHESLYKSASLSSIHVNKYVKKLIEPIRDTYDPDHQIQLELDIDKIELNINQAVPCALILNELLSNAFKHAFENIQNGYIKVIIKQHNNQVDCKISDNGKGLPQDFAQQNGDHLGFTIVKTLIKQLDASYQVNGQSGTTVQFSFPVKEIWGSSNAFL